MYIFVYIYIYLVGDMDEKFLPIAENFLHGNRHIILTKPV